MEGGFGGDGALPEVLTGGPQRPLYLTRRGREGEKPELQGVGAAGSSFLRFTASSQTQLLAAALERGWARRRWGPFPLEGWVEGAPPRGFPDAWPRAH